MSEDPDLEAGDRLRVVISLLARQLNASAVGEGLTPAQASVLRTVTGRGRMSLSDLTMVEGLNPTMTSRIVGELDRRGLVRRMPNEHDLRSASVEITDDGRVVSEHIRLARAQVVADSLGRLPTASRRAIVEALPALGELVDALIERRGGRAGV